MEINTNPLTVVSHCLFYVSVTIMNPSKLYSSQESWMLVTPLDFRRLSQAVGQMWRFGAENRQPSVRFNVAFVVPRGSFGWAQLWRLVSLSFVWNGLCVVSGLFPFLGFHSLPFGSFVLYFEEEVEVWAICTLCWSQKALFIFILAHLTQ